MDWIKGISPAIRILLIAIVLILLPAAALSYIGFLSVNERARNLETGYRGTLLLVRDRIEQEILGLEQDLRSSLDQTALRSDNRDSYRRLLREVESANPWLKHPFRAAPGGEVVTPSLFVERSQLPGPDFDSPVVSRLFLEAESAERAGRDLKGARGLYGEALARSRFFSERVVLLSRVGRVGPFLLLRGFAAKDVSGTSSFFAVCSAATGFLGHLDFMGYDHVHIDCPRLKRRLSPHQ